MVWAFFAAIGLNYSYQDTWILEGIWPPLAVALCFYAITVYKDLDPGRTALLTALFVFTVYSASVLKYTYIYGSTIDASIHFSMMRSLAEGGRDSNVYAFTPGFHLLVASLAQLSGLPVTLWAKIMPAFMGGLIPLSVYLLWNRVAMPRLLLRIMIILSGMSLPMLYLPDGTSYAILIFGPLLSLAILRSIGDPRLRLGLTGIMALLCAALVIWHAISSVLIPLVLSLTAIVGLLFVRLQQRIAYQTIAIRQAAHILLVTGITGFVMALIYWRIFATSIWEQLMTNVSIFAQALERTELSEGVLVPERTFTLQTSDLIITLLIFHARDGLLVTLGGLGGIFNLYALFRNWRMRQTQEPTEAQFERVVEDYYVQIIRLFLIVWVIFGCVLLGTLVLGFAKHGYQRFLLYIMAAGVPVAGYGLWKVVTFLQARFPRLSPHALVAPVVVVAFLVAGFQLFPYQPLVPSADIPGTDGTTPLFWQHQVNTDYQRLGLEFTYTHVDHDFAILTDYRTYHQMGNFIGVDAKRRLHYGLWPTPRPAYVLYHIPGAAGAYSEQAEYRSAEAIQARRNLRGVNTVYDNGGAFLMFVPARQLENVYVETISVEGIGHE